MNLSHSSSPVSARARLQQFAPYVLLALFTLIAYRTILFTPDTFVPWDLPFYHVPQAVFASASIRNGELPLWDPNTYCGRPIYAQLQPAYFYPFRILSILLVGPSPHVNMLRALEIEMVFHVFLAGVFTLWLARQLGMSEPAAMLSAAAYQLGFFFSSQAQHIGFMETGPWIPLALLAVIRLGDGITFKRFAVLTVALAMALLAGFGPAAIGTFAVTAIFALLYAVLSRRSLRMVLATIAGGVMAAMLAAIQLLPTMELTQLGLGHLRSTWKGTGGGISLETLRTLIVPNALGSLTGDNPAYETTLSYIYCGIGVLVLALVGAIVKPHRRSILIVILAVISAFGMFGDNTAIGKAAFMALPAFIQGPYYPTSWMPIFSLSMALLAGFGLSSLRVLRGWAYLFVLLCAADLLWHGSAKAMNTVSYDAGSIVLDEAIDGESTALAAMREATRAHFPPYRIDGRGDDTWASWSNLTGVPSSNGIDPLSVERLLRARLRLHAGGPWALSTVEIVDPKLLSLMNVRYFMTFEPLKEEELKSSGFFLSRTFPRRLLYENPNVLPRFFFVAGLVPSAGRDASLEIMNRDDWDPARMAIVEGIDTPRQDLGQGSVKVVQYANQEVRLETHLESEGFLSTSEVHYPGWNAYIDDIEVPVHYSNVAFRGIFVPEGDHQVIFKFRPAPLIQGAVLSMLTAMALALGLIVSSRKAGHYVAQFRNALKARMLDMGRNHKRRKRNNNYGLLVSYVPRGCFLFFPRFATNRTATRLQR